MNPRSALIQYLLDDATVSGLVSDRIYPVRAPQDPTKPYIVVQTFGGEGSLHTGGASAVAEVNVRVSSYGSTVVSADVVAKAVYDALAGYHGQMCRSSNWNGDTDQTVVSQDGQQVGPPGVDSDYTLMVNFSGATF